MKKITLITLSLMCTLFSIHADVFSHTFKNQTLTYSVVDQNARTCKVAAGTRAAGPAAGNNITGDLVIPEKASYNGTEYSVVGIGEYAYPGCEEMTSVSIPATVTFIGVDAFDGCDGLPSQMIDYSQPYNVYDLQGVWLDGSADDVAPGFYIVRQGAKVAKIMK